MHVALPLALLVVGGALIVHAAGGVRPIGWELVRLVTRPRAGPMTFVLLGGLMGVIVGSVGLWRGWKLF